MSSFDPSTPSQTLTPTPGGNSGSKLGIIIGSCVGGFFAVLIGVCLLVPFLRRRAARRASRDFEDAADVDTPRSHTRNLSEAGAPLLSVKAHHDSSGHSSFPHSIHSVHHESIPNGHGHDPVVDLDLAQAQAGPTPPSSSTSHEDAGGSTLYNPWRTRTAAPPPPAASDPSPPRATHSSLRRARTRIRATMAPVPEDNVPPPSPSSPPPPSPPPADHPSWLRIPSPVPLIGAFRRSVAASTSSRNTSASSLAGSANAAHAFPTPARSNETFRSFSSAASEGHTRSPDPHPSSQPQPQLQTRDIPARLRPSEPARVAQLVPGPFHTGTGPGSRAASLLSGSGGARSATGTGSELSVYTDARSNLDASELGERR